MIVRTTMASLWEALGAPPAGEGLPCARDPSWISAHRFLWLRLRDLGHPRRFRSPATLWQALEGTPLPIGCTWARLCANRTVSDLVSRIQAPAPGCLPTVTTWNVRWLHRTSTTTAAAKRTAILRRLQVGDIVLLQETHWTLESQAIWAGLFPAATVASAPSRLGPADGPQGGVAIIVPHPWEILATNVLVEGCCLEATVRSRRGGATFCLRSIYLPPEGQQAVLMALVAGPASDHPLLHGGDLNFQAAQPRNDHELACQRLWLQYLHLHHSAMVVTHAVTRRHHGQRAHLDDLAVPLLGAWTWEARNSWHPSLSDHAMVHYAATATPAATGRACTPAALQRLPTAAWTDLRARYLRLELQYHVRSDPLQSDAAAEAVPLMPALLRQGRASLSSMLAAWWLAWRHRGGQASHAGVQLESWMRRTAAAAPEGELLQWLRSVGWQGTDLTPAQAATWLHVWQQERALARRRAVHPLRAGPQVRPCHRGGAVDTGRQLFRTRLQGRGVRDTAGVLQTDPEATERLLWADRADIWTRPPPLPATGTALLDHYFAHRPPPLFPAMPGPDRQRLHDAVLARHGSAPGVDSEPYELYHHGANFVAHLLAQGHHAAGISNSALHLVLGGNVDLLIWIPPETVRSALRSGGHCSCPRAFGGYSALPSLTLLLP